MTFRILTVGDGDLSFSLALKRAYPYPNIRITASTLVESSDELIRTYSNAAETLQEFCQVWDEDVIFQMDATKLTESYPNNSHNQKKENADKFDVIMFNHPHLGDATLCRSEKHHAERHYALLCHYFHSAKYLLKKKDSGEPGRGHGNSNGIIHVCLCGSQPKTWGVMEAARRNGLKCVAQEGTSSPVHKWLFRRLGSDLYSTSKGTRTNHVGSSISECESLISAAEVQKHYPCDRRYRNGKLGSKHFLGRYGYRHRRTGGDLYGGNEPDMNVHHSVNFLFKFTDDNGDDDDDDHGDDDRATSTTGLNCIHRSEDKEIPQYACKICGLFFPDNAALENHLQAPAMPDLMTGEYLHEKKQNKTFSLAMNQNREEKADAKKDGIEMKSLETNGSTHLTIITDPVKLDQASKLAEAAITSRFDSKRLKWLCRQKDFPFSKYIKSKKQCTDAIRAGRIYVNGVAALDSGRIVKENDVVTLVEVGGIDKKRKEYDVNEMQRIERKEVSLPFEQAVEKAENSYYGVKILKTIEIQSSSAKLIAAFKPVGIRVCGSFSPQTLEMITQSILLKAPGTENNKSSNLKSLPISKLDTGCSGLCVLIASPPGSSVDCIVANLRTVYKFSALVHGKVPPLWENGVFIKLSNAGARKWKRHKTEDQVNVDAVKVQDRDDIVVTESRLDLYGAIFIRCTDTLNLYGRNHPLSVSTLEIQSSHDSGRLSNVISFTLRKLGYPVVNDRFCKRELSTLPRVMRNILKQKICIGCFELDIKLNAADETVSCLDEIVSVEPHGRTQCSYWKGIIGSTDTL